MRFVVRRCTCGAVNMREARVSDPLAWMGAMNIAVSKRRLPFSMYQIVACSLVPVLIPCTLSLSSSLESRQDGSKAADMKPRSGVSSIFCRILHGLEGQAAY